VDSIGIRELRQNASAHVAAASAGETITITDRGRPVAKLVPLTPVEAYLHRLVTTHGLIGPVRPRRRFASDQRLSGPALGVALADERAERDLWTA